MLVVRHIIVDDLDSMKISLPGHRKTLLLAVDILNREKYRHAFGFRLACGSISPFFLSQPSLPMSPRYL